MKLGMIKNSGIPRQKLRRINGSFSVSLIFLFNYDVLFVSQLSFPKQLSYFKKATKLLEQQLGNVEAKSLLKRSVYLINMGTNDYSTFYNTNPNATESHRQDFVATVIGNLTSVLQVQNSTFRPIFDMLCY